jgi:alkylhydroperoxidase/carboxymuconolactone decarboxylase family protein YurZ
MTQISATHELSDNARTAIEKGRAHFAETLGRLPEPIRAMMEHAPEIFAGFLAFREAIYRPPSEGGYLDVKTKELLYVVLDIAAGNLDGAKNHAHAAVEAGLTSKELGEASMQVFQVFGITSWATTGYKVVDYVAALEKESGNRKDIATR